MPEFAYKARNAQGGLVEGVLNCPDRGVAIRQIEQQNCIPIRIDPVITTAPVTPGPVPPRNFVPKIFMRLVKHLMQEKSLRDRVQQALIYPAFLTLAGAALITVFITFMVPQLTQFMSQNGGALPLPTRILMQAHHLITTYWWLGVLIVIGGLAAWRAFVRSDEGRTAWDRFRLRIPGCSRIVRHSYYAQFSRTLGTLTENGIPLLRSLDLVAEIAGNRYIEKKLTEVRRAVVDGAHLSAALAAQQMFPDLLTDMMAVGEQTGHFGQTMMTIADVYERELDRTVTIT